MVQKLTITAVLFFMAMPVSADFQFYRGVRQMGMGGAALAVVNDETSLVTNPTGLGKLRDSFFTVFDPEVTGSTHSAKPIVGTGLIGSTNPQSMYDSLDGTQGRPNYFKSQFFPSLVMPNFGIGLLGRTEVLANRMDNGNFDYRYQRDTSLNLGYNLSFWGGRIKLGFAGRLINRVEFAGELDPSQDSLAIEDMASEGLGLSVDTGLTLAAPWTWIPTLSVLVRDVGGTSFTFGDGYFGGYQPGTPEFVGQSVDVAFAVFPIFSNESRGSFTIEYVGVHGETWGLDTKDRLRVGGEVNLWDAYFFRAGYYAQTWTAGFEYANDLIQWQLASYSELVPVGQAWTQDRRAVVKFALRF